MLIYAMKRLLWFIPTLFIITILGFLLLVNSPGNPLDVLVNPLNSKHSNVNDLENQKQFWTKKLGLNQPLFYFSVMQLAEPDTLYKLYDPQNLKLFKLLLEQSGNASSVKNYTQQLHRVSILLNNEINRLQNDTAHVYLIDDKENIHAIQSGIQSLKFQTATSDVSNTIKLINTLSPAVSTEFNLQAKKLSVAFYDLSTSQTKYKNYIPKIVWYGSHNRYHHWLFGGENTKGIIHGDFGISYIKKEPVISIIKDKVGLSLIFSVLSIILAYVISIPLGISMAAKPDSKKTRFTELILFILYAMPSFFVGVLLLMLFANPEILSVFPPSGIKPIGGYDDDASVFNKISDSLPYIILPLICYTYSSLAFITKLTQTAVSEQLAFDYIKTAKAKGMTNKAILWKHALKNSLLPLITVFSTVFPAVIGGSVIIESIFTIPGMGLETIKAIGAKDYPIVIAVITLSAIVTMISYLLADLLYALADPRIRYKS